MVHIACCSSNASKYVQIIDRLITMTCCPPGRRNVHSLDSKYSWLVCASGVICNILVQGIVDSVGVLYPAFVKQFKETREKTAWIGSLCVAVLCFTAIFAGALCDRIGGRLTAYLGIFACSLGLLTTSYASHITIVYFTFGGLYGLGASLEFTSVNLVTFRYFKRHRSLAIGILSSGEALGTLFMAPVTEALLERYHLKITLQVLMGITLISTLVIWTFDPNVESEMDLHVELETKESVAEVNTDKEKVESIEECLTNEEEDGGNISNSTERKWQKWIDCRVWKDARFTVTTIALCIGFTATLIPSLYMAAYCEELGIAPDKAAWMYVYLGVASFCGRIIAGRLIDVPSINSHHVFQVSVAVAGVAAFVCPLYSSYAFLSVCFMLIGFMSGSSYTCCDVEIMSMATEDARGRTIGMYLLVQGIPSGIGPPLAGLIADVKQSYRITFYVSGALYMLAAIIPFIMLCACVKNSHCGQRTNIARRLARTDNSGEELQNVNS